MALIENSTHVDDIYFHQDPPYAFSIVLALLIDIVDIDGRGLFKKMTFAFTKTGGLGESKFPFSLLFS